MYRPVGKKTIPPPRAVALSMALWTAAVSSCAHRGVRSAHAPEHSSGGQRAQIGVVVVVLLQLLAVHEVTRCLWHSI